MEEKSNIGLGCALAAGWVAVIIIGLIIGGDIVRPLLPVTWVFAIMLAGAIYFYLLGAFPQFRRAITFIPLLIPRAVSASRRRKRGREQLEAEKAEIVAMIAAALKGRGGRRS